MNNRRAVQSNSKRARRAVRSRAAKGGRRKMDRGKGYMRKVA